MALAQELIRKKRDGHALTQAELEEFFHGYMDGSIADYQAAAMLMAIVLKGMEFDEVAALTEIMRTSGQILSWDEPRSNIIDKHSTGGVGDKTSLIILPLCTLEGLRVPMIAGRGLGHTGGTLDKLESIPGMNVRPSVAESQVIFRELGGVFMGQTPQIAALDRRLYALRDVTATIESIPLITASILSKKLAEGLGGLVMDVKYGSGAFMAKEADATALATMIAAVAKKLSVSVRCQITSMNSPLGDSAGNALEVIECVKIMRGESVAPDTRELTLSLAADMVSLANPQLARTVILERLEKRLQSGDVFTQFCKHIKRQGGDVTYLENPEKFPKAKVIRPLLAAQSGVIASIDVRSMGLAIVELGGGRRMATDAIDHTVGLTGMKRVGTKVAKGEPLLMIHGRSEHDLAIAERSLKDAIKVSERGSAEDTLILKSIG